MEDSGEKEIAAYVVLKFRGPNLPKEYLNYIKAKWMRSYRYNNDFIRLVDSDSYYSAYGPFLVSVILRPNASVRVAVLSGETDVALGFSVIENETLHYVFVHKDFRKNGIATKLIPTKISSFTHLTKKGLELWPTKLKEAKFNPFN